MATFGRQNNVIIYDGVFTHAGGKRVNGFEVLTKSIAVTALHNAGGSCDVPKCLPGTRKSILSLLEGLVSTTSERRITWFHGPAGVGKTAIVRSLAELLAEKGLLLADFFLFRADPFRNSPDYLIATLTYQLYRALPSTRPYIEEAIESNPVIFFLSMEEQLQSLIIAPMNLAVADNAAATEGVSPRVILIDGLDECEGEEEQLMILTVFSESLQKFPYPVSILIASRPEPSLHSAFESNTLQECSTSVALDQTFSPDADIRWFYLAKFQSIRVCHPLKAYLPVSWPSPKVLNLLVQKASGQFIFADTVIKFTSSIRHNPATQLDILLRVLRERDHRYQPFQQLDLLYSTIFQRVREEDIPATLRVLGIILTPTYGYLGLSRPHNIEQLLDLQAGEVRRLLLDLGSLVMVTRDESNVTVFHASLADFLFSECRSGKFFIDQGLVFSDLCIGFLRHPSLPIAHNVHINLSYFFEGATPTPDLHDAIFGLDMDLITSSRDYALVRRFRLGIEHSTLPDAQMMVEQLEERWLQAFKAQVTRLYQRGNLAFRMLLLAAAHLCGPREGLGHFIHLFCPTLFQEVVELDSKSLQLLRLNLFVEPFYNALLTIVLSTCGSDTYSDFAVQMWALMVHNHCPETPLERNLDNIPGLNLDPTLTSYAQDNSDKSDIRTLSFYICALFPIVLNASSVKKALTTLLRNGGAELDPYYQGDPAITEAIAHYLERAACETPNSQCTDRDDGIYASTPIALSEETSARDLDRCSDVPKEAPHVPLLIFGQARYYEGIMESSQLGCLGSLHPSLATIF